MELAYFTGDDEESIWPWTDETIHHIQARRRASPDQKLFIDRLLSLADISERMAQALRPC